MLNRVQIKEYRCLREVDVPLKPLTVLIGQNNTGKTAFLSALRLLGTVPAKVSHDFTIGDADRWRFQRSLAPTIVGHTSGGDEVRIQQGQASQGRDQRGFWIRSGNNSDIAPVNFFNNSALTPAMQSKGVEAKGGIPQINDNADNVPAYLDALLRKDRERFFRVLDKLKELIRGLANLNIETPSADTRRIDLVVEDGIVMDAKLASDGVKLLIFFVALADHPDPPKTILLEEPESGVHPGRLEDIVHLLIGLTEARFADRPTQVILTTHSPYLLDFVDPEKHQVLVHQREVDGACVVRPVDAERLKLFLDEFMLGEVWLNQEEQGLVEKVQ